MSKNVPRIQIPLDMKLIVTARANSYQQFKGDKFSQYFITSNFYIALIKIIVKITGIPLQELLLKRFIKIQKQINKIIEENDIDVVINLSGSMNTHLLNIWYDDLLQNKFKRKYILTDINNNIDSHKKIVDEAIFLNKIKFCKIRMEFIEFDIFKHNLIEILQKSGINCSNDRLLIFTEGLIYYIPITQRKMFFKDISKVISMNKGNNFFMTDLQEFDFITLLKRRNVTGIKKIQNTLLIKLLKIMLPPNLHKIQIKKAEIKDFVLENNLEIVNHTKVLVEAFDLSSFSIIELK